MDNTLDLILLADALKQKLKSEISPSNVFAIVRYSPLDIDSLLSGYTRTLDSNKEADFLYLFNNTVNANAKVSIIFNSLEYCIKRNLNIIDGNKENIVDVIEVLKKGLIQWN